MTTKSGSFQEITSNTSSCTRRNQPDRVSMATDHVYVDEKIEDVVVGQCCMFEEELLSVPRMRWSLFIILIEMIFFVLKYVLSDSRRYPILAISIELTVGINFD